MQTEVSLQGKQWHVTDSKRDIETFILERLTALNDVETLHWDDAGVFPDTAKAIARVHAAIDARETVAIFGDYDCDGVTATAQMVRFFRRHGIEPIVRLPHRVHDGYGMREKHIAEFAEQKVSLILTVDTGVTAHDALKNATEKNIDVIILDHHHMQQPPDAYAVLHPDLATNFPAPHPSAAGVVFLFISAYEGAPWVERDIDLSLALFGTVADLVPLGGKNRKLVQEGLRALQRLPEGPLKHLVNTIGNGKPLASTDIAFRIAPRINAAGRMDDPTLALTALLDGGNALSHLETLNSNRQDETARCIEHALHTIGETLDENTPAFLAVADASYTPGIVGLISGKLSERFGRPSMAAAVTGDTCVASLRSCPSYNIVEGLERIAHLLMDFGGHAQAAGCSFALRNFDAIAAALNADVRAHTNPDDLLPGLHIDAVIDVMSINTRLVLSLQQLEPYGQGNQEPLFLLPAVQLQNARRVGSDGKHLSATVGHCKLIGFGMGDLIGDVFQPLDIVCRIGMDTWNGKMTPQLFLVDARIR
ncbi:DHH family phosphoesterase [Candidatus Peribacteria bacterium]|nr:MAG: DHH family phosphoesterase [Candidatus Peribacteria bacterium]